MPQATFLFRLKFPMRFSASSLRLSPTRRSVSSASPYSAVWGDANLNNWSGPRSTSENHFAARQLLRSVPGPSHQRRIGDHAQPAQLCQPFIEPSDRVRVLVVKPAIRDGFAPRSALGMPASVGVDHDLLDQAKKGRLAGDHGFERLSPHPRQHAVQVAVQVAEATTSPASGVR